MPLGDCPTLTLDLVEIAKLRTRPKMLVDTSQNTLNFLVEKIFNFKGTNPPLKKSLKLEYTLNICQNIR